MATTPLADMDIREHPITTIVLESVGWITKTIAIEHAAGWLPGELVWGHIADFSNKRLPIAVLREKDVIGETVHDAYDEDEALLIAFMQPGDQVALRLKDGTSVEDGDMLVPTADGEVVKYDVSGSGTTDNDAAIIGIAMSDLDLTGDNEGDINLLPVLVM